MKARYSFLLNSKNKLNGSTNNSAQYYIDWSHLPQGKYNAHFTYNGALNSLDGNKFAFLVANFGAVSNSTYLNGTNESFMTILGILKVNTIKNTNANLYADDSTNEEMYLDSKPSSNLFTVNIFSNASGAPTLFLDDVNAQPADYLLHLHFDLLE